jgi:type I restriction enzyme M protein
LVTNKARHCVGLSDFIAMLSPELRSKIDALWLDFATNGLTNPLEVIEQVTYLLFLRRLDDAENTRERHARALDIPFDNPLFAFETQHLRWSKWPAHPERLHTLVDREVFPWMRTLGASRTHDEDFDSESDLKASSFARNLKDARLALPSDGALLLRARNKIDEIQTIARALATQNNQNSYLDTMGDLYEYLLSKLATAGRNGQFRTPRHIIQMMVELVNPTPRDIICDPACGTAGFLANAARTLQERHKSAYFDPEAMAFFNTRAFVGFDLDATMVRIASMNLLLHGIENPQLERRNALGIESAFEGESCDVILANPPFAGSVNESEIAPNLKSASGGSKKTELLFVSLFVRLLKAGGRAAVIVPDGVLFGASNAHKMVRQVLVEEHKLDGVISMPSGVFKPYAGVSTAILLFTKTGAGGTEAVWFYDMRADGFSLDDKRQEIRDNDIPDILEAWPARRDDGRTGRAFCVPKAEIVAKNYDLSLNRYKTVEYAAQVHRSPTELLAELRTLETQISEGLDQLEAMLAGSADGGEGADR